MSQLITIIILSITTISICSIIQLTNFEFSYSQQQQQQQLQQNQTINSDYSKEIDDNVFTTLRGVMQYYLYLIIKHCLLVQI
jgi:Tfp pilus assembly protein PilV